MCQFCKEHGEGKKWYLQAKNYADELWHSGGRREFTDDFFKNFGNDANTRAFAQLDQLSSDSIIGKFVRRMAERKYKKEHYGQIVPIEDVEQILGMSNSITRVACVCRYTSRGKEMRYCFGITVPMKELANVYPDFADSVEELSKEAASELMRSFESEGLTHSIWTFKTPYIGGICNCDQDCMAYKSLKYGNLKLMFKGEYIAKVDMDLCSGCRNCMRQCQYGAISFSASLKRSFVDIHRCFGCGICRATCPNSAITLLNRVDIPAVREEW